jgi:VanZ family protein
MFTPARSPHPHDRHSDPVPPPVAHALPSDRLDLERKPPVLRRSTLRVICGIWLVLVTYGTLGPLGCGEGSWLAPVESWHWIPPAHPMDHNACNDLFTNVLVYIPVGVALGLLVRRRGGAWGAELLLAMLLAITLSYVTELLQQFMPARCSDRGDLMVNAGAALLGCVLAPRAQRAVRRGHAYTYKHWRGHPWLVAAWAMTGVTLAMMTLRWDLCWPSLETEYTRSLDWLDFLRFATFGLLGFLIAMAMIERHGRQARALGEAVMRVFVCGVLLEAAQIFVKSHACALLDISSALLGGLAGVGTARWLAGRPSAKSGVPTAARRLVATSALLGLVLFGLIAGMSVGIVPGDQHNGTRMLWLPFQVQFGESFDRVVIRGAESLFLYASVTALCLHLTRGRGQHAALLLLVGMVGVSQTGRVAFLDRTADLTPLLLAVAAWLATVRAWKAFVPPARRTSDVPLSPTV